MEDGSDAAVIKGLRKRGHEVSILGAAEDIMGHAQVIAVEPSGALVGASDRRSDGQVGGW
jgi:gamma-glutamyltranspeptidase